MTGFFLGFGAGLVQFLLLLLYFAIRRRCKIARTDKSNKSATHGKRGKSSVSDKGRKDKNAQEPGKPGNRGLRVAVFAVTQFLFPFAVLVISELVLGERMIWTAVGIASSMIICFVVRTVLSIRKARQAPRTKR